MTPHDKNKNALTPILSDNLTCELKHDTMNGLPVTI